MANCGSLDETPERNWIRGFTLVELLVTVGIISLLATLLAGSLARARSASHSSACKNNLRQIGIALKMYVNDFNYFPPTRGANLDRAWPDAMLPYAGVSWPASETTWRRPDGTDNESARGPGSGIYVCPGYDRIRGLYQLTRLNDYWEICGSYGYNYYGSTLTDRKRYTTPGLGENRLPSGTEATPVSEADVENPADMIAFGDSMLSPIWDDRHVYGRGIIAVASPPGWSIGVPCLPETKSFIQRRHSGRWNVLFVDGHVEQLPTHRLFGTNAAMLKRWNRDNIAHYGE